MLRKIRLRNFRTHKDSELRFCSGVNGIIGVGTSGKTNILRALKLVFTNRPLGTGVISRFVMKIAQKTTVDTWWSDIGKITYVKMGDPKYSYYKVNDEDPYRKFGQNTPEPIVNAINLSDINFANQFDGPYLIFSGPGEISKTINAITGADEFDKWISEVTDRIKRIKFKLKDSDYRIEKYSIDRDKLDGLSRVKNWVDKASAASKKLQDTKDEFDDVTDLYNTLIGLKAKADLHRRIAGLGKYVKSLKRVRKKMDSYDDVIELSETLIQKRKIYKEALKRHRKLVKNFTRKLIEERRCPTCLSPIKQSTIQRLKNEIRITK
jgi:exonuclease SbcC